MSDNETKENLKSFFALVMIILLIYFMVQNYKLKSNKSYNLSNITSGGYIACISEEYFDEYGKTDDTNRNYLLNNGVCFRMPSGLKFSYIHRGILSSKIRLYKGNSSLIVWTANENLR